MQKFTFSYRTKEKDQYLTYKNWWLKLFRTKSKLVEHEVITLKHGQLELNENGDLSNMFDLTVQTIKATDSNAEMFQLEMGEYPTSYIQTHSTPETRVCDKYVNGKSENLRIEAGSILIEPTRTNFLRNSN